MTLRWFRRQPGGLSLAVTYPVAVLLAFRWLTWLMALGAVLLDAEGRSLPDGQPILLALTAVLSVGETLHATSRHYRWPLSRSARLRLLAVAVLSGAVAVIVIRLSGGWRSPFYHYAVTSLLVPAFLLRLHTALLWTALWIGGYFWAAVAGAANDDSLGREFARHLATLATPALAVVVLQYLAHLVWAINEEARRAERATSESDTLVRVAEAVTSAVPQVDSLIEGIANAVRRTGLLLGFQIGLTTPGRDVDAASPLADSPGRVVAPLAVRGEALGELVVTAPEGRDINPRERAFVEALGRQVALGVYDARLYQEREQLAAQAERARIAREIHDGLAQSLYMLSLGLEACAEAAPTDGELGRRLGALEKVSRRALWEARRYIFDLSPPTEGEHTLPAMLENLTREFETAARIATTFETVGDPETNPPPEVAAALYRVAQEALANAFKHAQATRVAVVLEAAPSSLSLSVTDNGVGLPAAHPTGHGLANMRQRAEDLGGTCTWERPDEGGTRVRISVPLAGPGVAEGQNDG